MRIGIDISQIVYQGTGVARFTEGLTKAILDYDRENQWLFFFSSFRRHLDKELTNKIENRGFQLIQWSLPSTFLSLLFNDFHSFSKLLTFNFSPLTSLDWFITSDWTEPPLPINKATIVHDLVYRRHPETVNQKIKTTQEKRLSWVKKESKIIFADSLSTKNDLINFLNINPNQIIVNYPGISIFNATTAKIEKTLKKYHLDKPFILTVGKLEPRKNISRLIKAFNKIKNKNIDLVIVGPSGWDTQVQLINRLDHIKYLGLIKDEELFSLYASCLLFVYPSLWEGFGYPLVEAMSLGAPIACSDIPIFKELAGDSAYYFNPLSINDLYQAMDKLANNQLLRKKLAESGKIKAKEFSWQRYYNTVIKTLSNF